MPIILLALTVHEFCHAYSALRMGDPTAYRMGRCSLNPLRHLDPLGTICLLFAPIGWAKPVPVNPLNFRNYRMGDLIVSAAGPVSNLAQAILFALLIRAMFAFKGRLPDSDQARQMFAIAMLMFHFAVTVNVGLAVFNCLPLFPLDGFHIALQLTRPESQQRFAETARMGPFLIMGIILVENFTQVDLLGRLINPPVRFFLHYVAGWPQFLS